MCVWVWFSAVSGEFFPPRSTDSVKRRRNLMEFLAVTIWIESYEIEIRPCLDLMVERVWPQKDAIMLYLSVSVPLRPGLRLRRNIRSTVFRASQRRVSLGAAYTREIDSKISSFLLVIICLYIWSLVGAVAAAAEGSRTGWSLYSPGRQLRILFAALAFNLWLGSEKIVLVSGLQFNYGERDRGLWFGRCFDSDGLVLLRSVGDSVDRKNCWLPGIIHWWLQRGFHDEIVLCSSKDKKITGHHFRSSLCSQPSATVSNLKLNNNTPCTSHCSTSPQGGVAVQPRYTTQQFGVQPGSSPKTSQRLIG